MATDGLRDVELPDGRHVYHVDIGDLQPEAADAFVQRLRDHYRGGMTIPEAYRFMRKLKERQDAVPTEQR